MDSFMIIVLILFCSLALIITLFVFVVYSGLFTEIKVGVGTPPVESATILYKFGKGSYKNTGAVFTEVTSIAPKMKSFGIYYDDPDQVLKEDLRWAVGVIAAETKDDPDSNLVAKFKEEGFSEFKWPSVEHVVKASFPCPTQVSVLLGIYMVYPKLGAYVKEKRLCAHPWIEIYDGENITYMAPLSKQDQFYVPETTRSPEPGAVERQSSFADQDAEVSSHQRSNNRTYKTVDSIKQIECDSYNVRSQTVHVVSSDKILGNKIRSKSIDAVGTVIQEESFGDQTGQYNDMDCSACSGSSTAESDISTASSLLSSEYSCSSVNTFHNSSVNSDILKDMTSDVTKDIECDGSLDEKTYDKEL